MSVSTTPFEPDEVEILATSIGGNGLGGGHALFYTSHPMSSNVVHGPPMSSNVLHGPPMSFRAYPEHKAASDPASGVPVVTFTR